jgi:alkylation response protein AidB-like acyl-CoA dehydrogenase
MEIRPFGPGTSIRLPHCSRRLRAQRRKYLQPILNGTKQYHIAISEPGTGSDAAGIQTVARRVGEHYVINGVKRWTQDPSEPYIKPDYFVVYAVTEPGRGYKGISSFLVDYPSDGIEVTRTMTTMAPGTVLGKVVDLEFTDCKVPWRICWVKRGRDSRISTTS